MQRNMFNDPRPHGHAEIVEALDELGLDASMCFARVEEEFLDDVSGGTGWTAEIVSETDDDLLEVHTLTYESKDDLLADLKASGVTNIKKEC